MKVIASFVGRNKDFRAWLAAGMPANVVSLAEYREKKKTASAKAARQKSVKSIVVPILPDGVA